MCMLPPKSTRTDTLLPSTTLFRSFDLEPFGLGDGPHGIDGDPLVLAFLDIGPRRVRRFHTRRVGLGGSRCQGHERARGHSQADGGLPQKSINGTFHVYLFYSLNYFPPLACPPMKHSIFVDEAQYRWDTVPSRRRFEHQNQE